MSIPTPSSKIALKNNDSGLKRRRNLSPLSVTKSLSNFKNGNKGVFSVMDSLTKKAKMRTYVFKRKPQDEHTVKTFAKDPENSDPKSGQIK